MKWFGTFKKRDVFEKRFYQFDATTYDKAQKHMIDVFDSSWENLYTAEEWNDESVKKRLEKEEYEELTERQIARHKEREGRIRYQILKEE